MVEERARQLRVIRKHNAIRALLARNPGLTTEEVGQTWDHNTGDYLARWKWADRALKQMLAEGVVHAEGRRPVRWYVNDAHKL